MNGATLNSSGYWPRRGSTTEDRMLVEVPIGSAMMTSGRLVWTMERAFLTNSGKVEQKQPPTISLTSKPAPEANSVSTSTWPWSLVMTATDRCLFSLRCLARVTIKVVFPAPR
jgi:hypothetical protein